MIFFEATDHKYHLCNLRTWFSYVPNNTINKNISRLMRKFCEKSHVCEGLKPRVAHCWTDQGCDVEITGDPLHSQAACTQPCNINTHSHVPGHGFVNNGGTAVSTMGHGCVQVPGFREGHPWKYTGDILRGNRPSARTFVGTFRLVRSQALLCHTAKFYRLFYFILLWWHFWLVALGSHHWKFIIMWLCNSTLSY